MPKLPCEKVFVYKVCMVYFVHEMFINEKCFHICNLYPSSCWKLQHFCNSPPCWTCQVFYVSYCMYLKQTVKSTKVPPNLSFEVAGFFSAPTEPICQEVCMVEFCSCNEFCACLFSFPVRCLLLSPIFITVLMFWENGKKFYVRQIDRARDQGTLFRYPTIGSFGISRHQIMYSDTKLSKEFTLKSNQ